MDLTYKTDRIAGVAKPGQRRRSFSHSRRKGAKLRKNRQK
jgi:hypothetical protein